MESKKARKNTQAGDAEKSVTDFAIPALPHKLRLVEPAPFTCKHPPGSWGYNVLHLCNQLRSLVISEEAVVEWVTGVWAYQKVDASGNVTQNRDAKGNPVMSPFRAQVLEVLLNSNEFLLDRVDPVLDMIRVYLWKHREIVAGILCIPDEAAMEKLASEVAEMGDNKPALYLVLEKIQSNAAFAEALTIIGKIYDRVKNIAADEKWDEHIEEHRILKTAYLNPNPASQGKTRTDPLMITDG